VRTKSHLSASQYGSAQRMFSTFPHKLASIGLVLFAISLALIPITHVDARDRSARSVFQDCSICPTMKTIPIPIASDAASRAAFQAIAVSVTPITFAQWDRCVVDAGCGGYRPERQGWPLDTPVVNVSFADTQNYIAWLTKKTGHHYRLIREHEWARIALAGKNTPFPWGNKIGRGKTNCLDCGSRWDGRRANPVKSFAANEFGLYDVVGNVAHWTDIEPTVASLNKSFCKEKGDYAAIMGASWAEPSKYLLVSEWACFPKVLRDDTIGFRVVKELR
jgi:formylglycine-generating enzyme required for sulfatase activity